MIKIELENAKQTEKCTLKSKVGKQTLHTSTSIEGSTHTHKHTHIYIHTDTAHQ